MEEIDNSDPDGAAAVTPTSAAVTERVEPDSTTTSTAAVLEQEEVVSSSTNNDIKDNTVVYLSREDSLVRYQDGSDSGVEVNGIGGLGCGMEAEGTPAVSCDSSLISCCYSSEDLVSTTLQLSEDFRDLSINAGDGTSEGGSESSSTTGYHKPRPMTNVLRKKCSSSSSKVQSSSNRPTALVSSSSRSRTPMSRDRSLSSRHSSTNSKTTQCSSTKNLHPSSAKSSSVNPGPSSSRSRAPSTDNSSRGRNSLSSKQSLNKNKSLNTNTDDGRWPSSTTRANQVNLPKNRPSPVSNIDKRLPHVMTSSFSHVETSSNALDKYATLPRRRRRSAENLPSLTREQREVRNLSREPSLNRTASLRQKHNTANASSNNSSSFNIQYLKSIPPYPNKNRTTKTRIYHEVSVQTSLTSADVDNALAGSPPVDVLSRVEVANQGVQVDRRIEEVERLELRLKEMQTELTRLQSSQQELKETKENLTKQQAANADINERLANLIRKDDPSTSNRDVVTAIEKQVHSSNDLINRQQAEIASLHALCSTLNEDLQKSYAAQKMLLQQQQEGEVEALEMQDFLQAEKSTLAEALQDTETELNERTALIKQKENDLSRLQDECSHLVRISEQRRQEALSMAARLKSVETRSKEALLQQGAAVSSAAVALSGLGTRLETLVDALVTTYAISEHDLEDVIFHNEAYSDSGSSSETSPQHSPKITSATASATITAGSGGFLNAVLNAIRSATSSHSQPSNTENSSESEQLLCTEPEPQAFANRDITCDSSPEKRLSIASVDDYEPSAFANSQSLQNLTEAILKRQQDEKNQTDGDDIHMPDVLPASTLVDQVIEVDNLITRLLKILHIIQIANEQTVKIKTMQLSEQINQKEDERQGAEELIERLRLEIHQLQSQLKSNEITDNQVTDVKDRLGDKEIQMNELGRKLCLTKQLLTDNWHQAMSEVRRQYDAIDNALEMLQSVQGIVQTNPVLSKVQQDLEETNFRCASMLPVISTSDLNANSSPSPANLLNITAPPSPTINGTA